jgi:hypothetical protein
MRVVCCNISTDHILIGDGRFRGEADVHGRVASPASVADDPSETSTVKFAVTHNSALW